MVGNASNTSGLNIIKRSANDTFVYMVVDNTYPVFKFSTFAPVPSDENLTSPEFADYLKTISYFLSFLFHLSEGLRVFGSSGLWV